MTEYDFVIVGSGLGGLLTGALLGKDGYSVCILEKNPVFGGSLQTFKRQGVEFDTGMHYFGSFDKGQFCYKLFKYLGIYDDFKLKKLDLDRFDILNFQDKEYPFAQGFNNFIDKLSTHFPDDKDSICTFIDKIKEIGSSQDMFNLIEDRKNDPFNFSPYYSQNAYDYISSITKNSTLKNVLFGLNELIGGGKEKTNMFIFGMTYFSYLQSSWRFVGGSSQLADLLLQKIKHFGGVVHNNTEVGEFVLGDNKNIESVNTKNGLKIKGKRFISNIHPVNTLGLLPENVIRKVYNKRISNIENSAGMFSLYIVLNEKSFKYMNFNYYDFQTKNTWINSDIKLEKWPQGYWLATQTPDQYAEYANGITVLTPIDHKVFGKWKNTKVGHRGADYDNLKTELAQRLIKQITHRFPELKQAIKSYYTATPLTYRDYLGSPNGTAYGFIKDSENPFGTFVLPKTQIKNLFLTGQNINGHGMLGVSTGSLFTISFFTDIKAIVKKINNAG